MAVQYTELFISLVPHHELSSNPGSAGGPYWSRAGGGGPGGGRAATAASSLPQLQLKRPDEAESENGSALGFESQSTCVARRTAPRVSLRCNPPRSCTEGRGAGGPTSLTASYFLVSIL